MSVQTQIDRIKGNVTRSLSKIAERGVMVPADANSDNLEELIGSIPECSGVDTSEATAKASQMSEKATAYVKGELVKGTAKEVNSSSSWGFPNIPESGVSKDRNNNRLMLEADLDASPNSGVLYQNGASIFMSTELSNLGDAKASDVVKGKKFTSVAGILVEGEHECAPSMELPTLDNPGTANDLVRDKQLIDGNGNVVTGNISERKNDGKKYGWTGATPYELTEQVGIGLFKASPIDSLFRKGCQIALATDPANFGDATAADVAKGKTFTSVSGLLVEGTHECSEGVTLPELTNPGSANDLASGMQLIDENGNIVTGELLEKTSFYKTNAKVIYEAPIQNITLETNTDSDMVLRAGKRITLYANGSNFGDAFASDVAKGKTFTSENGLKIFGTHDEHIEVDSFSNLHAWNKYTIVDGMVTETELTEHRIAFAESGVASAPVDYADTYSVASDGISLVNPTTVNLLNSSNRDKIKGKYIYSHYYKTYFYVPADASLTPHSISAGQYISASKVTQLTYSSADGSFGEFVSIVVSDDSNAYPQNGMQDGYKYVYNGTLDGAGGSCNHTSVTQATPSITVSDDGLITATSIQAAGLVSDGTTSATKQISHINLIPDNVKKDVQIFGITGSYEGSVSSTGLVVKTGTTTSQTINTGLSDIHEFFIYKESQTATGLIHLHYSKNDGTSYLYASAWSTNSWGTKTINNGTTAATVSGGRISIPNTKASSGGLSSGVTYTWVAIGKE